MHRRLVAILFVAIGTVDARALPSGVGRLLRTPSLTPTPSRIADDAQKKIDKLRVESVRRRQEAERLAAILANPQSFISKQIETLGKLKATAANEIIQIDTKAHKLGDRPIVISDPSGSRESESRRDAEKRLMRVLAQEPLHSAELGFPKTPEASPLGKLSPADPLPNADKAIPELAKSRKTFEILAARDAVMAKTTLQEEQAGYGSNKDYFAYDNNSVVRKFFSPDGPTTGDKGITWASSVWGTYYVNREGLEQKPLEDAALLALARETLSGANTKPREVAPAPRPVGGPKTGQWSPRDVRRALILLSPWGLSYALAEETMSYQSQVEKALNAVARIKMKDGKLEGFFPIPGRATVRSFYDSPNVLASVFQQAYVVEAYLFSPKADGGIRVKPAPTSMRWIPLFESVAEAESKRFFVPTTEHFGSFTQIPPELAEKDIQEDKHFYAQARERVLAAHELSGKVTAAARQDFEDAVKKYDEESQKANDLAQQADDEQKKAEDEQKAKDAAQKPKVASAPTAVPSPTNNPLAAAGRGSSPENKEPKDEKKEKPAEMTKPGGGEPPSLERAKLADVSPAQIPQQQPFSVFQVPQAVADVASPLISALADRLGVANRSASLGNLSAAPVNGGQIFQGVGAGSPPQRQTGSGTQAFAARRGERGAAPTRGDAGAPVAGRGADASVSAAALSPVNGQTAAAKGGAGGDGGVLNGNFENGVGADDGGSRGRVRSVLTETVAAGVGASGGSEPNGEPAATGMSANGPKLAGAPEAPIALGSQIARSAATAKAVGVLSYVGELKMFTSGKLVRRFNAETAMALDSKRAPASLPPLQSEAL